MEGSQHHPPRQARRSRGNGHGGDARDPGGCLDPSRRRGRGDHPGPRGHCPDGVASACACHSRRHRNLDGRSRGLFEGRMGGVRRGVPDPAGVPGGGPARRGRLPPGGRRLSGEAIDEAQPPVEGPPPRGVPGTARHLEPGARRRGGHAPGDEHRHAGGDNAYTDPDRAIRFLTETHAHDPAVFRTEHIPRALALALRDHANRRRHQPHERARRRSLRRSGGPSRIATRFVDGGRGGQRP